MSTLKRICIDILLQYYLSYSDPACVCMSVYIYVYAYI